MKNGIDIFKNYRELVAKVDEFSRRVRDEFAPVMSCREGCSDCCRHIAVFPVEAAFLAASLKSLPAEAAAPIRLRARAASREGECPLLQEGRCLLYASRPLICRTHGLPLLVDGKEKGVDYCPKNFAGITSFPAPLVLRLDLLNTTLAAINGVFNSACARPVPPGERLSIAEALLLEV